jgi:predicted TIM-barrel fold metal-dependent hydrolase
VLGAGNWRGRVDPAPPLIASDVPAGPSTDQTSPLRIIDAHHHYLAPGEGDALFGEQAAMERTLYARRELDERLRAMDADGIEQAVIMPGHGYLRPNGIADARRINDGVAAYQRARPDRFPVALAVAEPLFGAASLAELDRTRDELGLAGVTFHARFQGVPTDHRLIVRLIERMVELDLVAFIHAGDSSEEEMWRILNVARCVPEAKVVVLDVFDGLEKTNQALVCAELGQNLVFDTAGCADFEFVLRFCARYGAQRIVFGSNRYSSTTPKRRRHILPDLIAADLPAEDKHAIAAGNITRIFGL